MIFAIATNGFISAFQFLVQVVLVPIILLALFWLAVQLTRSRAGTSEQYPKILGLLLGLAIFVATVVINIYVGPFGTLGFVADLQTVITYMFVGIICGFLIMLLLDLFGRTKALPIFITILSGTSLVGLYYYILSVQSRGPVLLIVIGILIGSLIYGVFNYKIFSRLFS